MSIAKELTKEFFRPVIIVFWLGLLLAVLGGIGWHVVDKQVQSVKSSIHQVTAPMSTLTQPFEKAGEEIEWFAEGCGNVVEGYQQEKEQIHADFAKAISETYYNFFPKD